MSIYRTLLEKAKEGGYWNINLKTKTLKIGRKEYVKDGDVLVDEELICNEDFEQFNILVGDVQNMPWKDVVWHLYNIYYYSVPSKNHKDNSYFKAIDESELTDGERAFGTDRKMAQAMLEGYILLGSLADWIKWEEPDNHWFWQYDNGSELVVLKEWIEK